MIKVGGLAVQILRKPIKNLHLGVYPPNGRVRVAVPMSVNDTAVRLAVINKLGWIKRQQRQFAAQPRQSAREWVSGETHYFQGRPYRLRLIEGARYGTVKVANRSSLHLHMPSQSTQSQRDSVMQNWYRQQLQETIPGLLEKWVPIMGVKPREWGIRKMKTKWGSCNAEAGRVWLNLELAKKPIRCLEYLLVHELAHLIERKHNARFISIMDRCMPNWRLHKKELNAAPLGHETWIY